MKRLVVTPQIAFVFIVSILAFYCAWRVWIGLLGRDFEIFSLGMYGLAALPGAIALFVASRWFQSRNVRLTLFLAGLALLGMPFVFYFFSSPLLLTIVRVIAWTVSLGVCAGLFYISTSQSLQRNQRLAMFVAACFAIVASFMPWFDWIFSSARLFLATILPIRFWFYFRWAAPIIWAWAAIVMTGTLGRNPAPDKAIPTHIKRILVIGLCFFLLGMLNPVPVGGSTDYLVTTYVNGQVVDTSTQTYYDINGPLTIGAAMILIFVVYSSALRPGANLRSNPLLKQWFR